MPAKRRSPKATPPRDEWQITDEWGISDPAKAGMPALYARLGRPMLSSPPDKARRDRLSAARPHRSSEGVCQAIEEARRRAALATPDALSEPQSATRSARAPLEQRDIPDSGVGPARPVQPRSARRGPSPGEDLPDVEAPAAAGEPRTRARQMTRARKATPALPPASTPVGRAVRPPAPSPRRPRGPVPLAAWARASHDPPARPPESVDRLGFWREFFMIPAEVALVDYAQGCRIQRLVIEAAPDTVADF